ncbi:hypothetical protein ACFWBG_20515 [Nocardia salmonicida]
MTVEIIGQPAFIGPDPMKSERAIGFVARNNASQRNRRTQFTG